MRKSPPPFSAEHRKKISDSKIGKKHSEERRRISSEAHKGIKQSKETVAKRFAWTKGYKHSNETRKKISESNKGKTISEETRKKLSEAHMGQPGSRLGKKTSEEHKRKLSIANRGKSTGDKHHNWQGGKTPLSVKIRNSLQNKMWRTHVFQRDEYTCQDCKAVGSKLNADHIVPLSAIIQMYSIKTFEEAIVCEILWDIRNGKTLCVPCHKKTPTYAGKAKSSVPTY